jgi:hypothetical protein
LESTLKFWSVSDLVFSDSLDWSGETAVM